MKSVAVICQPGFEPRADFVADQIGAPLLESCEDAAIEKAELFIKVDESGLSLFQSDQPKSAIRVDFLSGTANHRRIYGGGKNQELGKATGLARGYKPTVLDMTAGLGRDGFVMATLGATVTLYERNPVVYWLLRDGLERGLSLSESREDDQLVEIFRRITLNQGSAYDFPENSAGVVPDVVYLDPMFPPREKSARVKKEMAILHLLLGEDADADKLLDTALEFAGYRVVVKRPAHAPFLNNQQPGYSLNGKRVRFDIYPLRKFPVD